MMDLRSSGLAAEASITQAEEAATLRASEEAHSTARTM